MQKNPIISVVMSVYNAEKYLRAAIESILNQSFKDFEFIIIEDCSTDHSLSIIEEYAAKDSRIIVIKKEVNKGTKGFIENLNLGLATAKGSYIARMDADDIADPNRFQKQVDMFEKDSNLFIVGSYLQMIDEAGNPTSLKLAPTTDSEIKATMYKTINLYHPALMFRNSELRYREKMLGCEDYDLYFQMMLKGKKMANIPEPLLNYRVLNNSISRKDKTFIRWAFVEKARSFYVQTKKLGHDTYNTFSPDDFSKILVPDFKNSFEDLKTGAVTALKFSQKAEFKMILNKIKTFYPQQSVTAYKIAALLPTKLVSIYSKLAFN